MSHTCHRFWNCYKPSRFPHFWQGAESLAPATQNHIWTFKSGAFDIFNILTWKCASCHNSVHFFIISTSKSAPRMVCSVHFESFWLWNVLRATTACTFSTSKSAPNPSVFYTFDFESAWRLNGVHFFDISTSKSGPNMRCFVCFVHFDLQMCFAPPRRANCSSLIWLDGSAPAALATLLFDPPEPQII